MPESIHYDENRAHLSSRIDAYRGGHTIDLTEFILGQLEPMPGERAIDLCCGTGKQSIAVARRVGVHGQVLGLDLQPELLAAARERARELQQLRFQEHDGNQPLPAEDASVDLVTCCFGIYYLDDLAAVIEEFHRVLRKGGRAFVMGPARDNNRELRELHAQVSGRPEPSSITTYRERIEQNVLPLFQQRFERVRTATFHNVLRFETVAEFSKYYRATPLLAKTFDDERSRDELARGVEALVSAEIEEQGAFSVRKTSLALIGHRSA